MKRRLALAVLLAAAAGPAAARSRPAPAPIAPSVPVPIDVPLRGDPLGAVIRRLPNGLTVYLSPDPRAPRVAARIVVRAGSADDPAGGSGTASLVARLLFTGTRRLGALDFGSEAPRLARIAELYRRRARLRDPSKRAELDRLIDAENLADARESAPGELESLYARLGAVGLDDAASRDATTFSVDVPSGRLEAWAAIESERFADPAFRLFPTELESQDEDRDAAPGDGALDRALAAGLYGDGPYGRPVLGEPADLERLSPAAARAFYASRYVPGDAAIVLAGDFDPDRAMDLIRRRFGAWAAAPVPERAALPQSRLEGERSYSLALSSGAEPEVAIAWPSAPAGTRDADAFAALNLLAGGAAPGEPGLLAERLDGKVSAAGSRLLKFGGARAWCVWARPEPGQTPEQAKALLLEAVDALKSGAFDDADLRDALLGFEVAEKRRLESEDARADAMAASFASGEPWERSVGRLDRLRRVTKADVARAAREYLGPGRVVAIRSAGGAAPERAALPGFTPPPAGAPRWSDFAESVLALPAPAPAPRWLAAGRDYQIVPVDGGRLYAARNPYDDLFQLTILYERGWRGDRELCPALDLLARAGAGPYPADEFARRLRALGASLTYSCGEQRSSVELTGVDRNFWPSLELMQQRFDWPNVSSAALTGLVDAELARRAAQTKDPDAVFHAFGQFATRGRESAALGALSDDELKRLDERRLVGLIQDFPHWRRRVAYVGPRSPSEVSKLLETFGRFKSEPPREPLRFLRPAKTRILYASLPGDRVRVGVSAPDEVFDPEHVVDYQMLSRCLSVELSSAVLSEAARPDPLFDSASAGHTTRALRGDETELRASFAGPSARAPEAVARMLALLRGGEIPRADFDAAKAALERDYLEDTIPFREAPAAVIAWEDEGLSGGDPRAARLQRLESYAPADLESFAKRFRDEPMTVWILGGRVDADALKPLGTFEERGAGSLFPY
ncbi:MAG: insulinase family protein [Elusimicrobia bacterium]|nr:insulinase family protein [Elusimicrobiota bacterium]